MDSAGMSFHPQHAEDPHDHVIPRIVYLTIFGVLMVLTVLTVAAATVDLGSFGIVVALAIAVVKATLVVLYFMHVRYSSRLTWLVIGSGVFWLFLLLSITMSDYLSRGWMTAPNIVQP
jgi:cytochrome c oxidase subunit IV